ncbi:chaperonin 10-like protein [Xylariales sp. PMI_506]|nr:chaperonin 10-like protein [Xylariales sp. PMI_506]
MKEALVSKGTTVKVVNSPIPEPGPDDVLIKVVVAGSNPKDWKVPEFLDYASNQGDDIAGVVHAVGSNVSEFKPGDRVFAFHQMMTPRGAWAEYAVAPASTVAFLPKNTSFEQGAAIPLAGLTASVGLYQRLGLPVPWKPATEPLPLVIYGAASAVGAYVVQLARKSNIHPLICVAGNSRDHVRSMIDPSKGDAVVDYRSGDEAVVQAIRTALGGAKLFHAFDAVSEKNSYINLSKVLEPGSKITLVLPGKKYEGIPASVQQSTTQVGSVHGEDRDFGYVFIRYLARGLEEGWFAAQPTEVIPGGLSGVQHALEQLKAGKVNAKKLVFRIADTDGVQDGERATL